MKKLKMGMVGGGIGAFIGEVHRKAARMDGGVEFRVCNWCVVRAQAWRVWR